MRTAALALAFAVVEILFRTVYDSSVFAHAAVLLPISIFLLAFAADVFTDNALLIGRKYGLSGLSIGIFIIAIGTSAPEIFSSIGAFLEERGDVVIGNVIGTVIANTLLGIGAAALFARSALTAHKEVVGTQIVAFAGGTLLIAVASLDGKFDRFEAAILATLLIIYLVSIDLKEEENDEHHDSEILIHSKTTSLQSTLSTLIALGVMVLSLIVLFRSGSFAVDSLISASVQLGLPEVKVATIVLAIGTSIPEIATAISLARKGEVDSIFGEIIGSNMIAIFGILGVLGVISPLMLGAPLIYYLSFSLVAVGFYASLVVADSKVVRLEGAIMLGGFLVWAYVLAGI